MEARCGRREQHYKYFPTFLRKSKRKEKKQQQKTLGVNPSGAQRRNGLGLALTGIVSGPMCVCMCAPSSPYSLCICSAVGGSERAGKSQPYGYKCKPRSANSFSKARPVGKQTMLGGWQSKNPTNSPPPTKKNPIQLAFHEN